MDNTILTTDLDLAAHTGKGVWAKNIKSGVLAKLSVADPEIKVGSTDIFTFLTDSEDHAILVRAIKVTGLKETLEGKGRFTAFAPNDAAFNALGDEVLESLFKAENRAVLKEVISYHVMPGSQGVNELTRAVNGNGGEARLKTLNGSTLNVRLNGDKVVIVGANDGAKAMIVSGDKVQNNGMVHTINTVVMPN